MVFGTNGKGRNLPCLLDTGCLKSIVLKKFNNKKQRLKLCDKVQYTTYREKFVSTETATLPLRLVEFGEAILSHEFQVDTQEKGGTYGMIIGSNIMEE